MTDSGMARELVDFLNRSPTCYHAAEQMARALDAGGYTRLWEEDLPEGLVPGGRYYLLREGRLIAFRLPRETVRGFLLAAVHSDSPTFKIRQEAEVQSPGGCVRLGVEPYGGGIWRSWLDRPLTVAGRAVVREGGRLISRLVYVDRDLLVIPSLAVHMDREVNRGTALAPQTDLLPLFALHERADNRADGEAGKTCETGADGETGLFRRLIADTLGVAEADLLETDLFLIPRTPATLTGLREEFIAASRLDDLQCAFACLHGFLRSAGSTLSGEGAMVPVLAVFNHEEVGSGTWQGADSTFLPDLLRTICRRYDRTFSAAAAASFLVSADNAHAVHPAHPEYADRTEFPVLGGGVVLKYNANQRYTTDAISAAVFAELCRRAGVPVQRYSNRADLPGGSTLGHIATAQVSVRSVDIGLPQLAMHSAWELAAVRDTADLIRAMDAYFSCDLRVTPEGITL